MQTSAKQVQKETVEQIESQFFKALAQYKSGSEMQEFLTAFLSPTEISVIVKRFAILKMLADKKSYSTIEEELKVSSATVSTVSKLGQEPPIAALLKELEADEWASEMTAKFAEKFSFLKKKEAKPEESITAAAETSILTATSDAQPVE